jgi:hypothetical protein
MSFTTGWTRVAHDALGRVTTNLLEYPSSYDGNVKGINP